MITYKIKQDKILIFWFVILFSFLGLVFLRESINIRVHNNKQVLEKHHFSIMKNNTHIIKNVSELKLGDGCRHVYIDLGTNVGVQIRKIYEEFVTPLSTSLWEGLWTTQATYYYDKYLGNLETRLKYKNICSFGFEPNPIHVTWLKSLEKCYNFKSLKTKIHTTTAVSNKNEGDVSFFIGDESYTYRTSSLYKQDDFEIEVKIDKLDIIEFILNEIKDRKIPPIQDVQEDLYPPSVMVQIDIEGEEYVVIPSLLSRGALCYIDLIMFDSHEKQKLFKDFNFVYDTILRPNSGCKLSKILQMDDEVNGDSKFIPEGCEQFF